MKFWKNCILVFCRFGEQIKERRLLYLGKKSLSALSENKMLNKSYVCLPAEQCPHFCLATNFPEPTMVKNHSKLKWYDDNNDGQCAMIWIGVSVTGNRILYFFWRKNILGPQDTPPPNGNLISRKRYLPALGFWLYTYEQSFYQFSLDSA